MFQLEKQDLVVLAELDLVRVNGLAQLGGRTAVLEGIQLLQALHSYGENLTSALQHCRVLALKLGEVRLKLLFSLIIGSLTLKEPIHLGNIGVVSFVRLFDSLLILIYRPHHFFFRFHAFEGGVVAVEA